MKDIPAVCPSPAIPAVTFRLRRGGIPSSDCKSDRRPLPPAACCRLAAFQPLPLASSPSLLLSSRCRQPPSRLILLCPVADLLPAISFQSQSLPLAASLPPHRPLLSRLPTADSDRPLPTAACCRLAAFQLPASSPPPLRPLLGRLPTADPVRPLPSATSPAVSPPGKTSKHTKKRRPLFRGLPFCNIAVCRNPTASGRRLREPCLPRCSRTCGSC